MRRLCGGAYVKRRKGLRGWHVRVWDRSSTCVGLAPRDAQELRKNGELCRRVVCWRGV